MFEQLLVKFAATLDFGIATTAVAVDQGGHIERMCSAYRRHALVAL